MAILHKFNPFTRWKKDSIKYVYSNSYWFMDTGQHIFPVQKYRKIYENLLRMGIKKDNFLSPVPASDDDILLVHTSKYLKKLKTGRLSHSELMTLELPFSPDIFEFFRLTAGGSITASLAALEKGIAVHIGGGFHHAFPDHGEGFCILNDVGISLARMKHDKKIEKAMVVDCDVHHGNGTAAVFSEKDYAFTFSIHQMDIYPARKPKSSLDVGLWTGDGDQAYIASIQKIFPKIYEEFNPDLVFYLAGADPYKKDQLGGLELSLEGLKKRDEIIIMEARRHGIPLVILFAGGYALDIKDTVAIHLNTIKTAQKAQAKYV